MSISSLGITLTSIRTVVVAVLDILVMWFILYYALKVVRTNQRTIQIFKGIILVVVIDLIAKLLGLQTLEFLTDMFINYGFLAIIIIFQPEIRSILEKIGQSNIFSRVHALNANEKENLVDQIVTATMLLSKDQTGALISIEQTQPLDEYIATGVKLDSDVTAELLTSLFVTSTPLHDGAVIIQGDKIACASAYFPPTTRDVPNRYGARHRAAIGFSEVTDAVTIVVSEETGAVSVADHGKIFPVNRESLTAYLLKAIGSKDEPITRTVEKTENSGLLSKLKLKKQEETVEDKVVVNTKKKGVAKPVQQTQQINTTPTEKTAESKDVSETVFNTSMIHKLADEEAKAAEMKLPHKKKRPQASYPKRDKKAPFGVIENPGTNTASLQKTQPVQQETVVKPVPKMTPMDVKAAREAAYKSLKQTHDDGSPVTSEDRQFDTSKLNISSIVGYDHELDKQFKMVEKLDSTSSDSEGGESHE